VAKTAFDAIVQRESPDADRSRLFARFESIFQLVWVVGALFPTLIAISLLPGFILIACTMVVTTSVFLVGLARDRKKPMASGRAGNFDENRAFDGPPPPDTYQPPDPYEPPALPEPPRWPAPAPAPDS
jgi:hypothetical protein